MPHGHHIYTTLSGVAMETMCEYSPSQYPFPHWKFLLLCYAHLPCIDLPGKELDRHHFTKSPTIRFRVYHLTARF